MNAKMLILSVAGLTVAAVAAHSAAAPVPFTPDSNTQLLYHLDEATDTTMAADSSGHGRNATYGSQVTLGAASVNASFGTAIASKSSSSARTTWTETNWATSFLNPANTPDIILDAWVKMTSTPTTAYAKIIDVQPEGSVTFDYSLHIYNNSNTSSGPIRTNVLSFGDAKSVNKVFSDDLTWDPQTWYHVQVVIHQDFDTPDNSYIKLYRQAATDDAPTLLASKNGADAILTTRSSTAARMFDIGNYYGASGNYYFPGSIDEVRFQTVPEPATGAMILLGGGLLALRRRRPA